MNGKLPRTTANKICKVLEGIGFFLSRQSGSHRIYRNSEGKRVTLPFHSGKTIHPKVLRNILKDAGLTPERFRELLG